MSKNISRRDFLKMVGIGAASAAVLTGCGPDSALCGARTLHQNA